MAGQDARQKLRPPVAWVGPSDHHEVSLVIHMERATVCLAALVARSGGVRVALTIAFMIEIHLLDEQGLA